MNKLQLQITNSPWEWCLRKGSGSWGNRVKLLVCHESCQALKGRRLLSAGAETSRTNFAEQNWATSRISCEGNWATSSIIPTAQTQNPCTATCEGSAGESQCGRRMAPVLPDRAIPHRNIPKAWATTFQCLIFSRNKKYFTFWRERENSSVTWSCVRFRELRWSNWWDGLTGRKFNWWGGLTGGMFNWWTV